MHYAGYEQTETTSAAV